jgi:hypothetical protein
VGALTLSEPTREPIVREQVIAGYTEKLTPILRREPLYKGRNKYAGYFVGGYACGVHKLDPAGNRSIRRVIGFTRPTGVPDYSIESAICKVAGTEFISYEANRALQLKGCEGSTAVD